MPGDRPGLPDTTTSYRTRLTDPPTGHRPPAANRPGLVSKTTGPRSPAARRHRSPRCTHSSRSGWLRPGSPHAARPS